MRNGKATAKGYTEVHNMGEHRRRVFRCSGTTIIFQSSDTLDGQLEDQGPAQFEVINPRPDTYVVSVTYELNREGKSQAQMCVCSNPCTQSEQQLIITPPPPGIGGKIDDPNHLRGTKDRQQARRVQRDRHSDLHSLLGSRAAQGSAR